MNKKIYYKLTNTNMKTYNGFPWELGRIVQTNGEGELCTAGWIHCYTDPVLAVLLNPIHADFLNPRLFEVQVSGKYKENSGLKIGWTEVTLIKEIKVPKITIEQKVRFAILCAKEVYKNQTWNTWADKWLRGEYRNKKVIHAVRAATAAYTFVVTDSSTPSNEAAANAAAHAADAATYASVISAAAHADFAANDICSAEESVANAIESAAEAADLDLIGIVRTVMKQNS